MDLKECRIPGNCTAGVWFLEIMVEAGSLGNSSVPCVVFIGEHNNFGVLDASKERAPGLESPGVVGLSGAIFDRSVHH
jgi:hypothetical protein